MELKFDKNKEFFHSIKLFTNGLTMPFISALNIKRPDFSGQSTWYTIGGSNPRHPD